MTISPSNSFTDLNNRSFIAVSGQDAESFLQSLITNDLTQLKINDVLYSCLLTPNGKFLYDFFVFKTSKRPDNYLIACEKERRDDLIKKLKMYKLRSQVILALEDEIKLYYLWDHKTSIASVKHFYQDPRSDELGFFYLNYCKDDIDLICRQHQLNMVSNDAFEAYRLTNNLPDGSCDMEPQKADIQQFNLDLLHGISFTKGCFIGQEPLARIHHRGLLKRRAFPVHVIEKETRLSHGQEVSFENKNIGKICSTNGQQAIAVLKIANLPSTTPILNLSGYTDKIQYTRPKWLEEVINLSNVVCR